MIKVILIFIIIKTLFYYYKYILEKTYNKNIQICIMKNIFYVHLKKYYFYS